MYTKLIKLLIASFLFFSCKPITEENEKVPSTILSEERFINVLTDAYLGEGAAGINIKNVTGDKYDSAYVFNPLADNKITKAQFDSALVYYTAHPQKLKAIYETILDRLSQIQVKGKLNKEITK